MNDRDEHIVNSLRRWIDGDINQKEENRLDRQAREDSFLGEALEGYRQFPGSKHQERLERMREQLPSKTSNDKKRGGAIIPISFRIAAAAAVVLAVGLFWWLNPTVSTELAQAPQAQERSSESMADEAAPAVVEDQSPEPGSIDDAERRIVPEREDAASTQQRLAAKQKEAQPAQEEVKPGSAPARTPNDPPVEPLADRQLENAKLEESAEELQIAARSRSEAKIPAPAVSTPPAPPPAPAYDLTISETNQNTPQGTRLVTGQVFDRSGSPLDGVLVVTPGDRTGTITNVNGRYQILLDSTIQRLEFQRTGFSSQKIDLTDAQDFVRVTLDESEPVMDQMVQAETGAAAKKSKSDKVNPAVHASSLNLNIAEPEMNQKRFERYLRRTLEYPQAAIDQNISGSVTLRFTILPDGRVMNVQAIAGPNELRMEAVRLIENGPGWKITNGSDKSITFTYRLDFSL